MVVNDEAPPHTINDKGETGRLGSCDSGMLSGAVNEVDKGGAPRGQSMLSGTTSEAGVEGEVVHLVASEVARSDEGSQRMLWFDRDSADLL